MGWADESDLTLVLARLNPDRPASKAGQDGLTPYQARGDDFARRLNRDARVSTRILVTGQTGVGKSSELHRFVQEPHGHDWVVHADLEVGQHPDHLGMTGVILNLLRACWRSPPDYGPLEVLESSFESSSSSAVDLREAIRDRVLTHLLDVFEARKSADERTATLRLAGRREKIDLTNRAAAIERILKEAASTPWLDDAVNSDSAVRDQCGRLLIEVLDHFRRARSKRRRWIFVIDHLDRVRVPTVAEDILVRSSRIWKSIDATIVMTAPRECTIGESREAVESFWGKPIMLYPAPIPESPKGAIPGIFRRVVAGAGMQEVIDDTCVRLLARSSGGFLRTYVQLLAQAAKEANFRSSERIELRDAQFAVHEAERSYQDLSGDEVDRLGQILTDQAGLAKGASLLRPPIGLIVALDSNGEQELRAHPLADRALERRWLLRHPN